MQKLTIYLSKNFQARIAWILLSLCLISTLCVALFVNADRFSFVALLAVSFVLAGLLIRMTVRQAIIEPLRQMILRVTKFQKGNASYREDTIERVLHDIHLLLEKPVHRDPSDVETDLQLKETFSQVRRQNMKIIETIKTQMQGIDSIGMSLGNARSNSADSESVGSDLQKQAHDSKGVLQTTFVSTAVLEGLERGKALLEQVTLEMASSVVSGTASAKRVGREIGQKLKEGAETSGLLDRMNGHFGEVQARLTEMAELFRRVGHLGEVSEDVRAKLGEVIDGAQGDLVRVTQTAQDLQGGTEGIERFLNTITDLSEQAHLLALNAAMISARSGGDGKRFGVVADEMRNLAGKADASLQDIGQIIQMLRSKSRRLIEEIKGVGEEVGVCKLHLLTLHQTMNDWVRNIRQLLQTSLALTRLSEDQSLAVRGRSGGGDLLSIEMEGHLKGLQALTQISLRLKEGTDKIGEAIQACTEEINKRNDFFSLPRPILEQVHTHNRKEGQDGVFNELEQIKKISRQTIEEIESINAGLGLVGG